MQDGTAGAVNLARPYVTEPVLIIFVDTVFEADLTLVDGRTPTASSGRRRSRTTSASAWWSPTQQGYMTKIVEKPKEPISKLANIGLYYIRDVAALWQGIDPCWRARRTRASTS